MPTPPDDILLNKAAIIERCIRRLGEEARACPDYDDFTHVDALTLNIERACQAAIVFFRGCVAAPGTVLQRMQPLRLLLATNENYPQRHP
ncbi:MAG: hypothetical protein FGM15_08505 [Chthoniobacterales bacterium]|nr:hypothetical protein [Chthoniobacterales bacterium]